MKTLLSLAIGTIAISYANLAIAQQSVCDKQPSLAACRQCVVSGPHVIQSIPLAQRQAWCTQFYDSQGKPLRK